MDRERRQNIRRTCDESNINEELNEAILQCTAEALDARGNNGPIFFNYLMQRNEGIEADAYPKPRRRFFTRVVNSTYVSAFLRILQEKF